MRYIGAKTNLLSEIENFLIPKTSTSDETLMDVFAGTNAVGRHFADRFSIISNDNLRFSYLDALSYLEGPQEINFETLKENLNADPVAFLNEFKEGAPNKESEYYHHAFSSPDGACYLTQENAKRVGLVRGKIAEWADQSLLNKYEEAYLVTALIRAVSSVSNTTGTYGAFLKHWDPRALKPLRLSPQKLISYEKAHYAHNLDVSEYIAEVSADIAYVDPPYNNRQYASNYHLIENIARNEQPDVKGVTRIFDWSALRSDFSQKRKAASAIEGLVEGLKAEHLVFSYNTEGIVPVKDLIKIIEANCLTGTVELLEIPYRKYQSKIPSNSKDLKEVLIYGRLGKRPRRERPAETVHRSSLSQYKHDQELVKSPVNYVGGKYRLLPQILPLFPKNIGTFVDLFSGGANVGINVNANQHWFNDMNFRVNEMFRTFQKSDTGDLVNRIENIIDEWGLSKENEKSFLQFRAHYNRDPEPLALYVLAAYSYNYQFRFNSRHEFNNPFGRNRSHFSSRMKGNLVKFCERLHSLDAKFLDGYFDDLDTSSLGPQDFVYADPPYILSTGSYNDGSRGFKNWTELEEAKLYKLLEELSERNIRWALSNVLEHKGVRHRQLEDFIESNNLNVHFLEYNYSNSSYNTVRKPSLEVLITNY